MKSVALASLLAALLLSLLSLQQWNASTWLVAPLMVVVGVLGASALQGGWSWLSVILGAISPLVHRWIEPHSPWLALAALCLLWTAPRVWLARTGRATVTLGLAAIVFSLLAGWITMGYADDGVVQTLAACVFAGAALSILPLLSRTDTPVSHALEVTARAIEEGPARESLLRAAEVHRSDCRDRLADCLPGTSWRRLAALADKRAGLRKSADADRDRLDREIVSLAGELTRSRQAAPPATDSTNAVQSSSSTEPGTPAPQPSADTAVPACPAAPSAERNDALAVEPGIVNATVP